MKENKNEQPKKINKEENNLILNKETAQNDDSALTQKEKKNSKTKEYFKTVFNLFFTMLKIGLFTFGGGYAMIALLQREFVDKKKWIDSGEFLNLIAIAESTPGPIAVNSATYIGYKKGKLFGSFMATLGIVIPSFIIIFCISLFFDKFLQLKLVAYAFQGIQAAVVFLILSAGIKMFKQIGKNPLSITLLVASIVAILTLSLLGIEFSTIYYILIGGGIGLIVYLINFFRDKDRDTINTEEIHGEILSIKDVNGNFIMVKKKETTIKGDFLDASLALLTKDAAKQTYKIINNKQDTKYTQQNQDVDSLQDNNINAKNKEDKK